MRLIDADVLKLGIISQSNDGRESYSTELICEFIDEQPTVGEWIPCSERFPEEDYDTVLAVTKKNHYSVYVYTKEYGFRTGDIDAEGDVIAWMPLPEPYHPNKCHGCYGAANNDCKRCTI